MRHKKLIATILVACLILLCAATILVSWLSISRISTRGAHIRLFSLGQFSAETDQEWSFEADGSTELLVDSAFGNVDITAIEGNDIKVTAHLTAWDYTSKRAENALAEMTIEVKQEGNQVILRYRPPADILRIGSAQMDSVDFTVAVPKECSVTASTNAGKIELEGVVGDADIRSEFGALSIRDVDGDLRASTKSGDILVYKIQAGQKTVYVETEFGSIEMEQASAFSIEARTNSGKVDLKEIDSAGNLGLISEFGDIQMLDSRCGALTLRTKGGKITLIGVDIKDALVAGSDFGDINIQRVSALGYDLSTRNGNISVENGVGPIKASTDFGGITISGAKNADLDLQTKSGAIDFSGSLGKGPHKLITEFGDIHLVLPKDARLTFDLKTEFGKLKSVFPITLSGEVEEGSWQGTINGGGANLLAVTNNGNITIDVISE